MRTRLALPIAAVLAVFVGGMTAYASNNATWHSTFSVAFATSLVNNTADFNFGGVAVGVLSGSPIDDLTITSNDPGRALRSGADPYRSGFNQSDDGQRHNGRHWRGGWDCGPDDHYLDHGREHLLNRSDQHGDS